MIQRIQSIILLLAALAFGALFLLPFGSTVAPQAQGIFADSVYDLNDSMTLLILATLGALVALICIFMFKNRKLQIRLGYLGMVISLAIPAAAILIASQGSAGVFEDHEMSFEAGFFMPVLALVLFGLANFYIGKDEKLVKSMDRLR